MLCVVRPAYFQIFGATKIVLAIAVECRYIGIQPLNISMPQKTPNTRVDCTQQAQKVSGKCAAGIRLGWDAFLQ